MRKSFNVILLLLSLALPLPGQTQEPLWRLEAENDVSLAIYSELSPLELNTIHSWELVLTTDGGLPLSDAEITVAGGMPLHDHGLPTQPLVNSEHAPGRYLLEGIRFHMPGQWQLLFTISYGESSEIVQLDFEL